MTLRVEDITLSTADVKRFAKKAAFAPDPVGS
jgi:hypothetical protein